MLDPRIYHEFRNKPSTSTTLSILVIFNFLHGDMSSSGCRFNVHLCRLGTGRFSRGLEVTFFLEPVRLFRLHQAANTMCLVKLHPYSGRHKRYGLFSKIPDYGLGFVHCLRLHSGFVRKGVLHVLLAADTSVSS